MKKRLVFFTILSMVTLVLLAVYRPLYFAHAGEVSPTVSSVPVVPSSYLEYFKLNDPIDVSVGDDYFVIAEAERLVSYHDGEFTVFDLDKTITKIAVYKNFCLYLSASNLYYVDLTSGATYHADSVSVANYFSLCGDTLVTNPSGSVYRYHLSVSGGEIDFGKRTYTSLEFDAAKITLNGDDIYYFNEGKILPFDFTYGTGERLIENLDDVRYTSSDGNNIYFTSKNGVNKIDVQAKTCTQIAAVSLQDKLFLLQNPQGVCAYGGYIYVVDGDANAVYQMTTDGEFTSFTVTDRGDAPTRLENATALTVDGSTLYALETDFIKSYDVVSGKTAAYSLSGLSGASAIAAANGYLFLSTTSSPYLVKVGETLTKVTLSSDMSKYKNVTALTAYENDFYFINNESINSTMFACVYKLSTADMTITPVGQIEGRGNEMTCDVFGTLYVVVYKDMQYSLYSRNLTDFAESEQEPLFSTTFCPKSLFVDIESDVYYLYNGNVTRYSPVEGVFKPCAEYRVELSSNLPQTLELCDFVNVSGTSDVYLLTPSVLLKSSGEEFAKDIKTPARLLIPEDYSVSVSNPCDVEFATVSQNAKLFAVELNSVDNSHEYFAYTAFKSQTGSDDYILLAKTDRYYLLFDGKTCALARKEDVTIKGATYSEYQTTAYAVDDFNAYTHPVANEYFKCADIARDQKLTTKYLVTFNGVNYVFLDAVNAYVPQTLLKPAVSSDDTPTDYFTVKIKKGGADVYADAQLTTVIGDLSGEVEVFAAEQTADFVKIYFNNGFAYIKADAVVPSTYYAVRNLTVVAALFIALMITVIYVVRLKLFKDKNDDQ